MSHELFDDDYDPLAPPAGGIDVTAAEESRPGGVEGAGVVRCWFDEGRLTMVRVSPLWYERLPPGQTLAQAFEEAFLLAGASLAVDDQVRVDTSSVVFDLPPFGPRAVEAYGALLHEHSLAWQATLDESRSTQPRASAAGEYAGVTVQLNRDGHPERLVFDEDWLDEVQVGQICSAVLGATQKAYAGFVPADDDREQQLERLRIEHEILLAGFRQLLDPRREER